MFKSLVVGGPDLALTDGSALWFSAHVRWAVSPARPPRCLSHSPTLLICGGLGGDESVALAGANVSLTCTTPHLHPPGVPQSPLLDDLDQRMSWRATFGLPSQNSVLWPRPRRCDIKATEVVLLLPPEASAGSTACLAKLTHPAVRLSDADTRSLRNQSRPSKTTQ